MQRLRIQLYFADPRHSTTNGQVERAHSTLIEIARCLKEEYHLLDTVEIFHRAAQQYNLTIHSVTNEKPFEVFHNKVNHENLRNKLLEAQTRMLQRNKPTQIRTYEENEEIYEKLIGQRDKLLPRYKKQKIKEDLGNKVKVYSRNRIIHKENIKN